MRLEAGDRRRIRGQRQPNGGRRLIRRRRRAGIVLLDNGLVARLGGHRGVRGARREPGSEQEPGRADPGRADQCHGEASTRRRTTTVDLAQHLFSVHG